MPLAPRLMELLACPSCGASLADAGESLTCAGCRLSYPVREGIPVLLADQAIQTGDEHCGS